ncbi:MAG: glycosyltransferase family 2 protein [Candidatus Thorarchaeota archaeon]|jgi:glycosyltransferase involved in cell wall biosynthesis
MKRGVAIVTYNRGDQLEELIEDVKSTVPEDCSVVVCDDGSTDNTSEIVRRAGIPYVRGPNLGVGANKNRALYALQDCNFIAIIEDDLFPQQEGWFQIYEEVAQVTDIHHFCRVQDKTVEETIPDFTKWLNDQGDVTPIYSSSPRGDFTFITSKVIRKVGALHPEFKGAGYAHGNWSRRIAKAGLISHPLKWIDIKEARDMFTQKGDTSGGRWNKSEEEMKAEIAFNREVSRKLDESDLIYHPLVLS